MADRYEDRERYDGGRSQDAGRRSEFERGHDTKGYGQGGSRGWSREGNYGRESAYGDEQRRGGFGYRGGEGWRDDPSGWGSGRDEGRYGIQSQNRDDYDERGNYNRGNYNAGSEGRRDYGMRPQQESRRYRGSTSVSEFYPRGEEWSSGRGISMGLGGSEQSEYSNLRGSGNYYGGPGQFGADPSQYTGGIGQYADNDYGSPPSGRAGADQNFENRGYENRAFGNPRMRGGMSQHQQQASHAGRGPKGYKRSDDRIKEDVNEHLTHDPHIDASEIDVQVKDGEVTLTGTVDQRAMKRRAEDIVENVSGVREIHNQLRVQMGQDGSSMTSGQTSGGSSSGSNPSGGNRQSGQSTGSSQNSGTQSSGGFSGQTKEHTATHQTAKS